MEISPRPQAASPAPLNTPAWGVVVGGALVAIGSFLPWISATIPLAGSINRSGIEGGDGLITVILGVLVLLVGISALRNERPSRIPTILLTFISLGIVVFEYANITGRIELINLESGLTAGLINVGIGVWVMGVGAVAAFLSSLALKSPTGPA